MSSVTLEEAQAYLPQLIERLRPGEEIVITRDDKPVATVREIRRLWTISGLPPSPC